MATGRLGANDLAATTNTTVYTVPADTFAVITVAICNRNAASRNVRLAISDTGTPADADYLEYDVELLGNGILERSGIVLEAGSNVVVYSSGTTVNAVVYGIETSTV